MFYNMFVLLGNVGNMILTGRSSFEFQFRARTNEASSMHPPGDRDLRLKFEFGAKKCQSSNFG